MMSPELKAAVKRLARTIRQEFESPQFIPGCEVKSIADINDYATNNGWIEALCGEHNQQRVRYKAFPANVSVGDELDVIYYPQHGFFEVYGGGGASSTGANNAFVSKIYEPDLSASALAADNSGDITISGNIIMSGTVKAIEGISNSRPDLGDPADSTKKWGSIYQAGGEGYFADGDITFSVQDAWNLKSTPGTWLKFNGASGAYAILPQNTTVPDLGGSASENQFANAYLSENGIADQVFRATWFDYNLLDTTEGNHFDDFDASYPDGWTEVDAPQVSETNNVFGFWYIQGVSTDTAWKYRKQSGQDGDSSANLTIGPFLFRDGQFTNDVDYYLGLYRDSGGIDENTFVRVHLQWDSATPQWRCRGEVKDGTTQTDSAWLNFSVPLTQPLWFRIRLTLSGANIITRSYLGTVKPGRTHTLFQSVNIPTASVTWGTVWMQFHQTRGAGVQDFIYIGGIDAESVA